jgi:hypothetical protein
MSPHHPRCSDTTAWLCRAPRLGEATYAVEDVARRGHGSTNARSSMSLRTIGWSDTLRAPCRSRRPGGATSSSMRVALRACMRRPVRASMSPFTSSSSDRQGPGRRASRGSQPTCSRWHVAPHACEARHRSGCSVAGSLRVRRHSPSCLPHQARGSGDMPRPRRRRPRERLSLLRIIGPRRCTRAPSATADRTPSVDASL